MNNLCGCGSGKKYERCCAHGKVIDCKSVRISELIGQAFAHYQKGQFSKAKAAYEQVLRRNPDQAEALCFLGVILHQEGSNDLALEHITRAIAKDPSQGVFYLNLGAVLEACGNRRQAIVSYRKSIALDPDGIPAHTNLGQALLQEKLWPEAASSLARALELSPKNHHLVNSLGIALEKMGRLEKSVVCYRKALSLCPDSVEALTNLGNSLQILGFRDEAIVCYRRAVALNPRFYSAHCNLGVALNSLGQREAAAQSCETARELQPDSVDVNLHLGHVYEGQGRLAEAVECYQQAVELDPLNAAAQTNLAGAYFEMGRLKDAREGFEKALEIAPNFALAYSNLLFFHAPTRDISPEAERARAENWEKCALSEEARLAARARASRTGGAFAALPRAGRRLHIGIVTAELGTHAVAEFLEPFLEHLDKQRFHLTFFPTVAWSGARTQRMVALADKLVSLVAVPHAQAADRIRAEQIDILMDTTGHTNNCHLGILAHRAAPVQMCYVGYWSTTGLTEMDWFLSDLYLPPECDAHFSEGLWRLPRLSFATAEIMPFLKAAGNRARRYGSGP